MSSCPAKCTWQRPTRSDEDPQKVHRLAKRYELALSQAVNEQAQQIDPRALGVSPRNRLFSIQRLHSVIIRSYAKDGHDPSRPLVGICREVTDPAKLASLIDHNQGLSDSSPLMPPTYKNLMGYEVAACNH